MNYNDDILMIRKLKREIRDLLYEALDEDFEDALALRLHETIPEYDPEWCVDEETSKYSRARDIFIDAVMDELFTHYTTD